MVVACRSAFFIILDFIWYLCWNSWNVSTLVFVGSWSTCRAIILNVASSFWNLYAFRSEASVRKMFIPICVY